MNHARTRVSPSRAHQHAYFGRSGTKRVVEVLRTRALWYRGHLIGRRTTHRRKYNRYGDKEVRRKGVTTQDYWEHNLPSTSHVLRTSLEIYKLPFPFVYFKFEV